MVDVEDLRAALNQPPAEPYAEPDLVRIMADGGRIRRRRRLLSATGVVAAAAAVVAVVVFAVQLRQPAPVAQPALPPPVVVTPTSGPAPDTVRPALGDVVPTGLHAASGEELVLYAVSVDEPLLPEVHFGLVAGYRDTGGSLNALMLSNETERADRSFGFHATDGGEDVRGTRIPVFGYFSGPAASITTTVHGRPVSASVQAWTEDPGVVFFWFDPAQVPTSQSLTPLVAYDKDGKRLTK